jgi:hypothetical protein
LLKVDVEGSEHAIIEETGRLGQIDQIILEYHHHVQPDEDLLGAFLGSSRDQDSIPLSAPITLPFP